MYNVSSDFQNYIKMPSRTLSSRLIISSHTYTDDEIIDMSLESNLVPGEEFTLGCTICNKFEVNLITSENIIALNTVNAFIGLDVNGTIEEVPLGLFNIDDVVINKKTKKITAYDNMIKLEKAYFSDLTYPASIQAIAAEICNKAGVSFNSTLQNHNIDKIEGKTLREAIGIIAGMCGGFARINRSGALEIVGLTSTSIQIGPDNFFDNIEKADKDFSINKITVVKEDNSTLSAGNGLSSEEITFSNNYMSQSILDSVFADYSGFSYRAIKLNGQGNPSIDVGDIISVTDVDDKVYTIPVMMLKLTYSGGLKIEISSVSKSESKSEYNYKGTINTKIERIVTEQIVINEALINRATIEQLEATNARIQTLEVESATISDLNVQVARIDNLQADKASITQLNAQIARIDTLQADKANITDLNATNAKINTLEVDVADINSLLAGNIGASNLAAGAIQAGSAIIADAAIGSAQIIDLDVSKINAGDISTAKFTILGADGRLKIQNNKLQVFDGITNLYERIVLGDVNGDGSVYGLRVRGSDGATVLLSEEGISKEGFTDGYGKVDEGSLDGKKLDIATVVTQINNGTTTIQGSKVYLDNKTLDVEISDINSTVNSHGTAISQAQTDISANASQISLKASQSSLNTTNSNVAGLNTRLTNAEASLTVQAGEIATKVTQTEIDNAINDIQIGSRNLLQKSSFLEDVNGSNYSLSQCNVIINHETYSLYGGHFTTPSSTYEGSAIGNGRIILFDFKSLGLTYGDTLTFSVDVKGIGSAPQLVIYHTSAESSNFWTGVAGRKDIDLSEDTFKRFFISFTIPSKDSMYADNVTIYLTIRAGYDGNVYFKNVKLEKGTKATDWTPAPEDVQGQLDTHDTRISTAETSITQNSNAINLKASQTSLNTTNSNVSGLDSRLSTAEASLTIQAGQIATKVTQTEVNTAIDDVEIGGRNLILNSNFENTLNNWSNNGWLLTGTFQDNNVVELDRSSYTPSTSLFVDIKQDIKYPEQVDLNIPYTISFYIKCAVSGTSIPFRWYLTNITGSSSDNNWTPVTSTTDWIKVSKTLIFTNKQNSNQPTMYFRVFNGSYVMISKPKFEKGNKATDWTPAPEDVQGQLDNHETRVTTAESSITQNANSIALKASQSSLDTTNSNVSGLNTRLSSAEASLVVNANSIATKVSQTEVNTAKTEAISIASADATTKANNAKADAITTASNDATAKVDNAKDFINNVNTKGLGMKVNYAGFTSPNEGELYMHGFDADGNAADVDGFILVNGNKLVVKKQMINTNYHVPTGYIYWDNANQLWYLASYDVTNDIWKKNGTTTFTPTKDHYFCGYAEMSSSENYTYATLWNSILDYKQVVNIASTDNLKNRVTSAESSITQNANSIALKVSQTDFNTLSNRVSTAESSITQNASNINLKVTKNDVVNQINLSNEGLKINASKIDITGAVTFSSLDSSVQTKVNNGDSAKATIDVSKGTWDAVVNKADSSDIFYSGTTEINGGFIKTGTLSANKITTGTLNASNVSVINLNASNISTGTLNASRIGARTITIDKMRVGSFETSSLYVRGTGSNNNANRVVKLDGNYLVNGTGRGLYLTVLNRSDHSHVSNASYDVYGSETDRNNLANDLNALGNDKIIILTSYDAINTNGVLISAIERCGGGTVGSMTYRLPYVLIGIPEIGRGNGIEIATSTDSSAPYAETNILIIDGCPQGISAGFNSTTIIRGDQITTGTLNANNVNVINLNASNITAGTMSADKIKGGTLTLGGSNNTNGVITMKDGAGHTTMKLDNLGFTMSMWYDNQQSNQFVIEDGSSGTDLLRITAEGEFNYSGVASFESDIIVGGTTYISHDGISTTISHNDILFNRTANNSYIRQNGKQGHLIFQLTSSVNTTRNIFSLIGGDAKEEIWMYPYSSTGRKIIFDNDGEGANGSEVTFRPDISSFGFIGSASYKWYKIYASVTTIQSDRNDKENIILYDGEEALNILDEVNIYSYNYKGRKDLHIGAMVDELPNEIVDFDLEGGDATSVDLYSYVSVSISATKELLNRIKLLEEEIKMLKGAA